MIYQAYDYAGSWLTFADNQANLYGGARTGVNTDAAVKHFVSSGATVGKINMGTSFVNLSIRPVHNILSGIPLYGRAFEQTAGLGQSYSGVRRTIELSDFFLRLDRLVPEQLKPGYIHIKLSPVRIHAICQNPD
jgi:GH18 family chitinase